MKVFFGFLLFACAISTTTGNSDADKAVAQINNFRASLGRAFNKHFNSLTYSTALENEAKAAVCSEQYVGSHADGLTLFFAPKEVLETIFYKIENKQSLSQSEAISTIFLLVILNTGVTEMGCSEMKPVCVVGPVSIAVVCRFGPSSAAVSSLYTMNGGSIKGSEQGNAQLAILQSGDVTTAGVTPTSNYLLIFLIFFALM